MRFYSGIVHLRWSTCFRLETSSSSDSLNGSNHIYIFIFKPIWKQIDVADDDQTKFNGPMVAERDKYREKTDIWSSIRYNSWRRSIVKIGLISYVFVVASWLVWLSSILLLCLYTFVGDFVRFFFCSNSYSIVR